MRLIQLRPSHTLAATRWTLQLPVLRRRRLNQWNIELSDSTGVSVLVISNVATRVVEVVVDERDTSERNGQ